MYGPLGEKVLYFQRCKDFLNVDFAPKMPKIMFFSSPKIEFVSKSLNIAQSQQNF